MKTALVSSARRPAPVSGPASHAVAHPSPPRAASGIALVITLILLAVITFMAVAFLVLSQRLRSGVANATNQIVAKQAADIGLQHGLAQIMAPIKGGSNAYNF